MDVPRPRRNDAKGDEHDKNGWIFQIQTGVFWMVIFQGDLDLDFNDLSGAKGDWMVIFREI